MTVETPPTPLVAAEERRRAEVRAAILAALRATGGNRTHAAPLAGYGSPRALRRGAARVGLDLERDAPPPPDPRTTGGAQTTPREAFAPRRSAREE